MWEVGEEDTEMLVKKVIALYFTWTIWKASTGGRDHLVQEIVKLDVKEHM